MDKLCFIHSFKVGGTSLREFLANNYSQSDILPYDYFDTSFEYVASKEIEKNLSKDYITKKLIFGHLKNWHQTEISSHYKAISMVREPVARVISRYYHLRNTPDYDYMHAPKEQKDLIDITRSTQLEHILDIDDDNISFNFCNHQYKMLSSDGFLSERELWDRYLVIGVLDRFNDFCNYLSSVYGFTPLGGSVSLNKGNYEVYIDNALRSKIEERNSMDIELYNKALGKW